AIYALGSVIYASLLPDASGNLYGMTMFGGSNSQGAVFKLSQSGDTWNETVLYSFCQQANCTDGRQPSGGLIMDSSGNLFGTTPYGGNSCPQNGGCGVTFKLAPNGQQTVLHAFCAEANCADGAAPAAAPFLDANGNLFGT